MSDILYAIQVVLLIAVLFGISYCAFRITLEATCIALEVFDWIKKKIRTRG